MKHGIIICILMVGCFSGNAQNSENTDEELHRRIRIPFERPEPGITDAPAMIVGNYVFYPEKKLVGICTDWVDPITSTGFLSYYVDKIPEADYDSFEILDIMAGIAKDKDNIYVNGKALGVSPQDARIVFGSSGLHNFLRLIKKDRIYVFEVPGLFFQKNMMMMKDEFAFEVYKADEVLSNTVFRKQDSLFVYQDGRYVYCPEVVDIDTPEYDTRITDKPINRFSVDKGKLYYASEPVINRPIPTEFYTNIKLFKVELTGASDFRTRYRKGSFPQDPVKKKEKNLSFLNFNRLEWIEETEYMTDGTWLIYKNNVIGKIDSENLKVYTPHLIEDGTYYFNYGGPVEKNYVKIKIVQ